jgi:hypothetical protein
MGQVLNDKTVTVEAPGRVFLQPKATFYDDGHTAYFVTDEEKFTPRAECTLIAIDSGDPKVVAGPVKMYVGDCSRESSWTKLLKRQLKHAP